MRTSNSAFRFPNSKFQILHSSFNSKFQIPNSKFQVPDSVSIRAMRKIFCIAACVLAFGALPTPSGTIAAAPAGASLVDGLAEPVEILRDKWGINHIYAQNES